MARFCGAYLAPGIREVMLVEPRRSSVHLPINADGYLESLRANGEQWLLNCTTSAAENDSGPRGLDLLASLAFISQREVLATTCDRLQGAQIVAMTTDGRRLWEDSNSAVAVWPLVVVAGWLAAGAGVPGLHSPSQRQRTPQPGRTSKGNWFGFWMRPTAR